MNFRQFLLRLRELPSFFRFVFLENNKKKYIDCVEFIYNKKIAMSCDIYPIYYPKQIFFRSVVGKLLTHLSYRKLTKTRPKTIYVSLDFMDYFSKVFLPKINWDFILVSGDSDYPTSKFKYLLKNPYLKHWFAQNNDLHSGRITSIPIGIDFSTLFGKVSYFQGDNLKEEISPSEQEKIYKGLRKNKGIKNREKIFCDFHLNITSKKREEIYSHIKNNSLFFFQKERLPREDHLKLRSQFLFLMSPPGAGLDCYRTWEALLLNQIPIVIKTGGGV